VRLQSMTDGKLIMHGISQRKWIRRLH